MQLRSVPQSPTIQELQTLASLAASIAESLATMPADEAADVVAVQDLGAQLLGAVSEARIPFSWVDGPLVAAMKAGDIILIDELNLADDAVLERLNRYVHIPELPVLHGFSGSCGVESCCAGCFWYEWRLKVLSLLMLTILQCASDSCSVLEPTRTIMLAEKGGSDAEVVVAHPDFRIVATMNPGGDYGKKELSPALSNRFTSIWVPAVSSTDDMRAILLQRLDGALSCPTCGSPLWACCAGSTCVLMLATTNRSGTDSPCAVAMPPCRGRRSCRQGGSDSCTVGVLAVFQCQHRAGGATGPVGP